MGWGVDFCSSVLQAYAGFKLKLTLTPVSFYSNKVLLYLFLPPFPPIDHFRIWEFFSGIVVDKSWFILSSDSNNVPDSVVIRTGCKELDFTNILIVGPKTIFHKTEHEALPVVFKIHTKS